MISKSVQLAKEDISKEMSIFISRDMIARFERDGNDCTKSSPEGRMVQILPPQHNIVNRKRYHFPKTTFEEDLNYMSEQYWVEKAIMI